MPNEFNAAHEFDKRAVASEVPLLRLNGVGKSTLSKIVCSLVQATTGSMLLDG